MRNQALCLLLFSVVSFACKGDSDSSKKKEEGEAKPVANDVVPVSGTPKRMPDSPFDAKSSNALWELAPEDTIMGIVAAPGSGQTAHAMVREILKVVEARPLGKTAIGELRSEAISDIGFDPYDSAELKKNGLDPALGMAIFVAPGDKKFGVFPISDRQAFRAMAKGKIESAEGIEFDRYQDDLICMPKEDRYLCAETPAALTSFGKSVKGSMSKQVNALPSDYRGHIELVMDVPAMAKEKDGQEKFADELSPFFAEPKLGIFALRLGRGTVTARVWFQAKPQNMVAQAIGVSNSLASKVRAEKPGAMVAMRVPKVAWESKLVAEEDKVLPNGMSVHKDILGNLTGEMVIYAGSGDTLWGRISIGLKEVAPFEKLLSFGCAMLPALPFAGVESKVVDGSCEVTLDVSKLPLPSPEIASVFKEPVLIRAEVKDKAFSLTIGKVSKPSATASTEIASEFLTDGWNFNYWMQNISIATALNGLWPVLLKQVPAEKHEDVKMVAWVASQLNSIGYAASVRDDGVHGILHVGTYAADSDEAYSAYQAAVRASIDSQENTFDALHEKYPQSISAQASKSGGSLAVAGILGFWAAVAIPAFTKYKERSEQARDKTIEMDKEFQKAMKTSP